MADILDQFTNAELKEILRTGAEGVDKLYGSRREAYDKMIDNQNKGIPNFNVIRKRYGGPVRKMHAGGEVKGMGAAIRGTSFKGVF